MIEFNQCNDCIFLCPLECPACDEKAVHDIWERVMIDVISEEDIIWYQMKDII